MSLKSDNVESVRYCGGHFEFYQHAKSFHKNKRLFLFYHVIYRMNIYINLYI